MKVSARTTANRQNAKRSTGPRTIAGKARVARNALQHGLSVPIEMLPEMDAAVARLAKVFVGKRTDPQATDVARRIASAQFDIERARQAKLLLIEKFKPPHPVLALLRQGHPKSIPEHIKRGHDLKRILNRPLPPKEAYPAIAVPSLSQELGRLDRYERRALSRRKFAMREMEASVTDLARPEPNIPPLEAGDA